jgi:membrane-bound metal-dependent hydrolase YbcI (DUF457 family)
MWGKPGTYRISSNFSLKLLPDSLRIAGKERESKTMMGTTHAPLGALAALATVRGLEAVGVQMPTPDPGTLLVAVGIGLVSGLLPDIDQPSSLISNPGKQARSAVYSGMHIKRGSLTALALAFPFWLINQPVHLLSEGLRSTLGHRGVMHSVGAALLWALGALLITLPLFGLRWWVIAVFVVAGYLSHLLSDGLTHSGQPLLWPLSKKKYHVAPPGLRVSASGLLNAVLGVVALVALLVVGLLPYFEQLNHHAAGLGR